MYSSPAPLIGLVGYAQAGKDTFGAALGYRRIAFADTLKAIALESHPEIAWWVKERGWEWAKSHLPGCREFLQALGVSVRYHIGPDTWVNAAFRTYDPFEATVITDVRFQSEVDAVRERKGIIVRITREGLEPVNNHVSEQLVATIVPDYDITAPDPGVHILQAEAHRLRDLLEN